MKYEFDSCTDQVKDESVTNTGERKKRRGWITTVIGNRFSATAIAVYLLTAIGSITSLVIGSPIAAAVAAAGAGTVILLVALDVRIRMNANASSLMSEMHETRRKAIGSHDYAVRVESRAKFRYDRLSGTLAKAHSENVQQRAILDDLLGAVASIPEPFTEEMLRKRFSIHSGRITRSFAHALEAQSLGADVQRRAEIEDIRNIILSALAIQRAELNILTNRLSETAPRV